MQATGLKNKEEPMTEVKRVPYRITDNEECNMFGDHSYSSSFDKINAIELNKNMQASGNQQQQ